MSRPFLRIATARASGLLAAALLSQVMAVSHAWAQQGDHITIGAGVAAVPDYQGADDYRVLPFPLLDIQVGRVFANPGDGIGYNVIDTPGFKAGGSITYVRGYRRRDVPDGIDKLSGAVGGRVFASLRQGRFAATMGATRSIGGGTHGLVADARLSYAAQATERLTLIPTLSTSWASGKHMRRYFGIDAAEAAASGLDAYQPSSGIKDISTAATANYRLASGLNLTGSLGISHLFDKAADSALVEQRWQPTGFVGISYSF